MLAKLFLSALLVMTVAGLPQQSPRSSSNTAQIVRSENDNPGSGNYKWSYETDQQQSQQQEGRFEKAFDGFPDKAIGVKGSFTYIDTDNKKVIVEYTSGINGYKETRTFA